MAGAAAWGWEGRASPRTAPVDERCERTGPSRPSNFYTDKRDWHYEGTSLKFLFFLKGEKKKKKKKKKNTSLFLVLELFCCFFDMLGWTSSALICASHHRSQRLGGKEIRTLSRPNPLRNQS